MKFQFCRFSLHGNVGDDHTMTHLGLARLDAFNVSDVNYIIDTFTNRKVNKDCLGDYELIAGPMSCIDTDYVG